MRLFLINCLLLASVAALPNEREKRDFSRIKNWITSAILGRQQINIQAPILGTETEYKLYRLPGYDNMMVKVPKTPVVKEFMFPEVKPVNINAFGSVVGTKSNDQTLVAVKEVKKLLSTGILNGQYNNMIKKTIVPMFPGFNTVNYAAESIKPAPVIETRPVVTEVIKPYEDQVEVRVPSEPKYSYRQIQNNVPLMKYTHNYPNVKVVETIVRKAELPMCIKKRIDDVIMLGAEPQQLVSGQVYQFHPSPALEISYPRVDTNSYIQNQKKYGGLLTEKFGNVAELGSSPQPAKDGPVRYNLRPTKSKAINPRPIPFHSQISPLSDIVDISATKTKDNSKPSKHAFTNLGDKVKVSQTLGPIPPQYISHSSIKGQVVASNNKPAVKPNGTSILGTKDTASNGNIPSYVYQHVYNPNTGKVLKSRDELKTNAKTNTNNHVVKPVVNSKALNTTNSRGKYGVFTNKVTAKPQSFIASVLSSITNAPKDNPLKGNKQRVNNTHLPLKDNPIVVADVQNYSYRQKYADGSSMNVKGYKNGVTVDVKENNKGRGDIPDQ